MSIQEMVFHELSSVQECTAEDFVASPETLPQINRNIKHPRKPRPLTSINVFRVRIEEDAFPDLFIMILAFNQHLQLAIKHGFVKEWNLSLEMDTELPSLLYVGGIIKGRIPHTIVAADWRTGFLGWERIFLPLTSEKLDSKLAKKTYRSQEGILEPVSRLNANAEIKALLTELNYSCDYAKEKGSWLDMETHIQFGALDCDSLTEPIYLRGEGLVYVYPVSDEEFAVTVASTPRPVAFPFQVFSIFDKLWNQAKQSEAYLEELLLARKILFGLFTPYRFILPQKIRLVQLIARTIQDCNYEGEVKSRYLTNGGVSDFINCLVKPPNMNRTSVQPSGKVLMLTKQEFLESAPQYVVRLMQNMNL